MTSLLRNYAAPKEGLTRFVRVDSLAYENDLSGGDARLFPFSYSNGTLDISYAGNNFKQAMVDITGVSPNDSEGNNEVSQAFRIIGGPKLVTALGDNFKAYIRAWRDATIDSGSLIEIEQPGQVIRVQEGNEDDVSAISYEGWKISEKKPASDNYISGSITTNYNTNYIFKTPLTFTIKESGVKKYITFNSCIDQE
jgi:hypothetical protein